MVLVWYSFCQIWSSERLLAQQAAEKKLRQFGGKELILFLARLAHAVDVFRASSLAGARPPPPPPIPRYGSMTTPMGGMMPPSMPGYGGMPMGMQMPPPPPMGMMNMQQPPMPPQMGMSMMGMAPPHPMMMQQGPPGAPMPPAFGHAYPPQPPAGMYSVCNGLRRCDAEPVSYTHLTLPTNREV